MISVVLPAFNESSMLNATVDSVFNYLQARDEDFQIVIVENGSTDNTGEIGQKLADSSENIDFYHSPIADYGTALRKGFQNARGDIVVNFDVDFIDLDFLERAVSLIRNTKRNRPAIVVGSKRAIGARDERSSIRRLATLVFSSILRFGFGLGVTDTHGIKAFHRASVAPLETQCHFGSDLFDTELILRCERDGLIVNEIPVVVIESRPARSPLLSRIPRTLKGLAAMRILFIKESFVRRNKTAPAKMHM